MGYKIPVLLLLISGVLYYLFAPVPPLSDTELSSQLHNKVVLICGASSGIGEELAYQMAGFGAKLVLVARSQNKLDAVRAGVLKLGVSEENVRTIAFDFSDVNGSGTVVDQAVEWFGKLDYLVANHAAVINGPFLLFPHQQEPDFLNRIFRVNVLSHIELTLKALPHIEKTDGHIYITSSTLGEMPFYTLLVYSSTKHAMNGFFYSLQQELIAKESNVALTIGALGLIKTKAIAAEDEMDSFNMPDFFIGDLKECARGMAEAYITRPTTMTYPKVASNLFRLNWLLSDTRNFHKGIIDISQEQGVGAAGYQHLADRVNKKADLRKELNYQQGYGPGDKN